MRNLLYLLFQTLLLSQCINADEVGADFDSSDYDAWEESYGSFPYKTYQSTSLTSPAVGKKINTPECYDGRHVFFTPRGKVVQNRGTYILDNRGELVWAHNVEGEPYNLKMQMYQGQQHLTFWLGDDGVGGHGEGDYYILNSSYHEVAKISALNDLAADLHEMVITPEGTAILSIYQALATSDDKGRRLHIWDCLFQEIDIATNQLVFQWRASEHHKFEESFREQGNDGTRNTNPWDWYHLNSVQKDEYGNYLVSARYTHTITYVKGVTGDIIWVLGGKRNMFEDTTGGSAVSFASQHLAQMHPLTAFPNLLKEEIILHGPEKDKDGVTKQLISLFDNGRDDKTVTHKVSRGLLVEVTYPSVQGDAPSSLAASTSGDLRERSLKYTVREVKSYDHPEDIASESQGSFQVIPSVLDGHDPNVLLGYGRQAVWTEFSAEGDVICDTHFATERALHELDAQSYRVLKFPWTGQPAEPPVAVVSVQSSVFVSWNGATEVDTWVLQHANSSAETDSRGKVDVKWVDYDTIEKTTFETEIYLYCDVGRFLRVLALHKTGDIIGTSNTMDLGPFGTVERARPEVNITTTPPMQTDYHVGMPSTTWLKITYAILFGVSFIFFSYAWYHRFVAARKEAGYARINSVSSVAESRV
ncbi:hypothetical protein MBLNU459_g5025t2 [Dothideomycetes sp. NU459]